MQYAVLFLILLLMLSEWLRGMSSSPMIPSMLQELGDEVVQLLLSKVFQLVGMGMLLLYFFFLLRFNAEKRGESGNPQQAWWRALEVEDLCKCLLVLWVAVRFFTEYESLPQSGEISQLLIGIDQSTNVLVLLGGVVLGQFVELAVPRSSPPRPAFARATMLGTAGFLALASLVPNTSSFQYWYRGQSRAMGLWCNPNTYGLLMAMGMVFALTYLIRTFLLNRRDYRCNLPNDDSRTSKNHGLSFLIPLCIGALVFILLGTGLIRSFSRGALLAALAGCAYVLYNLPASAEEIRLDWLGRKATAALAWSRRNKWVLVAAGCAAATMLFTQDLNHKVARRTASVINTKDFSWQNRLISYEGALQIMAEHPLSGVGLGGFQREFQQLYAPPMLAEHWSIILNDYLTVGMALGIPALLCFACLLWVGWNRASLCHRETSRSPNSHLPQAPPCSGSDSQSLLSLGYRGALIVLLIGFWFDGGLFKLALATPFWVFLELGRSAADERRAPPTCSRGSSEIESPCTSA